MNASWLRYIFYGSTAGVLLAETFGIKGLWAISKPLIVLSLAVWFAQSCPKPLSFSHRWVFIGLLFGWLGDVALMFVAQNGLFFIAGLVAFLLGHLAYIVAFWPQITPFSGSYLQQKPLWMVLTGIYALGLLFVLWPHVQALTAPVTAYAAVLSAMVLTAWNRKYRVVEISFRIVWVGALLFLISDSILAVNKFVAAVPFAGIWIMGTYIPAQWAIARGMLELSSTSS